MRSAGAGGCIPRPGRTQPERPHPEDPPRGERLAAAAGPAVANSQAGPASAPKAGGLSRRASSTSPMPDALFRHNRHRAAVTAVRVTAQITLFGAAAATPWTTGPSAAVPRASITNRPIDAPPRPVASKLIVKAESGQAGSGTKRGVLCRPLRGHLPVERRPRRPVRRYIQYSTPARPATCRAARSSSQAAAPTDRRAGVACRCVAAAGRTPRSGMPTSTEILTGLSLEQAAELTRQVRDRLVAYASPDGVTMPGAAWLVTARAV